MNAVRQHIVDTQHQASHAGMLPPVDWRDAWELLAALARQALEERDAEIERLRVS